MELDQPLFINDPSGAYPIPQVIYAGTVSSVDYNLSYSPPSKWSGISVRNLPLPVSGPNNAFFLCGNFNPAVGYILYTRPSPDPIGSVSVLLNATGNMSSGDLYNSFAFIDRVPSWPGGIVESITITISGNGCIFTGDPIYGILNNNPYLNPPYTGNVFVIDDPGTAGQQTATYTGDGTLYFPPASPLYITIMGGFVSFPTGSTITVNGISGSGYITGNIYTFGLVNI